ncbi:MAG: hypothetical protein QOD90_5935 [Mycobacterium sp.]|jgi:hypothetical protein|nr:hypothetical protein [Mycobacterium sp.]
MGAAAYIGRVGGLAIALGVGTAIATGYGVAAAEEPSSSPPSSSSPAPATSPDTTPKTEPTTEPATEPSTVPTTPTTGAPEPAADEPAASSTTPDTLADGVVISAQTNTGTSVSTAKPEAPIKKSKLAAEDPKPKIQSQPETQSQAKIQSQPESQSVPAAKALAVVSPSVESASSARVATIDVTTPTPAQPAPQNPLDIVGSMVSSVVNWVLSPLIGSGSTAPAEPPLAWSLLAFARREFDNFVNAVTGRATETPAVAIDTTSLSLAAATTAFAQAAVPVINVPAFPTANAQLSPSTQFVQWVTGNYQTGDPLIADTLNRFGITGTDVGVIWDNGMVDNPATPYNEHQVLMAFGDTFSGTNMTGNWRFNVLLRSADPVLSDGMTIAGGEWYNGNMFGGTPLSSPTTARQIIHPDGLPAGITLIPTAGISIPTPGTRFGVTQYVNFMSVTNWGAAGTWTTNYSAIAYSEDNGENWKVAPTSVRYNDPWSGNANFQQGAFVRPGDGYVYSYGTPNGRQGAAYVSRVAERDILDTTKYDYYSAGSAGGWFGWGATPAGWYRNQPAKATAVFGQDTGACGVANPGNQVSEMSVQYNKQLKKYVALHGDQFNNIVMRTSDSPTGTWSTAKVILTQQPGGIYAPMMHPWSSSTMGTGTDLYWNLSLFTPYNVMLMKTDLTKV